MLRLAAPEEIEKLRKYALDFPELEVTLDLAASFPELLQAIIISDKTESGMVLLSFWDDIYLSAGETSDTMELVEYLVFAGRGKRIIAQSELMEKLFPGKCENVYTSFFAGAECVSDYSISRAINIDEYREIYPLLNLKISFEEYYTAIRRMERRGASKTYYTRQDGKVVSTAATQIESRESAIITSVATHIEYRRKGLATGLVKSLARELKREGKSKIVISYMDESAGNVYHSAGFRPYLLRKTVKLG